MVLSEGFLVCSFVLKFKFALLSHHQFFLEQSQALSNMCMGEQRKIIVQPKVAAGMKQQGIGGDVPLNEVLEFFLEMAQIMPANAIEVEVLVRRVCSEFVFCEYHIKALCAFASG
jgi:predicted GNAT family acetyltransferase